MEDSKDFVKILIAILIVLMIVAAVIAIAIFGQKGTQKSMGKLEGQVNGAQDSTFNAYDGTEISGTQVQGIPKSFVGQNVAVLIGTYSKTGTQLTFHNYGMLLKGFTPTSHSGVPEAGTGEGDTTISTSGKAPEKGYYSFESLEPSDTGRIPSYNNTSKMNMTGSEEYIKSTAQFRCYLIRNSSEEIIGIACLQMK